MNKQVIKLTIYISLLLVAWTCLIIGFNIIYHGCYYDGILISLPALGAIIGSVHFTVDHIKDMFSK